MFVSSRSRDDSGFVEGKDCKILISYLYLVSISYEVKIGLSIMIILINILYFVVWVFFFAKDMRLMLAIKLPKIFITFCLCCRRNKLDDVKQ